MNVHDSYYSVVSHGETELYVGPFAESSEGNLG